MCLVFVLKARGRRGITKAGLRDAIADYAECPTTEAFERMLERDKRDLRDAGVIVDVIQRDAWHEDEHAYVLGAESLLTVPSLDADELRVLALAAEAWERGTWEALAHGALHKLEVFGPDFSDVSSPRITVPNEPRLDVFRRAIRDHLRIQFSYRRPGDREPSARTVEPWGLLARDSAWYCIAYDCDRAAGRVFRLSRIVGEVNVTGSAEQPRAADWLSVPHANPEAFGRTPSTLLIEQGRGWAWRRDGQAVAERVVDGVTYDVLEVEIPDSHRTIGALAAAAPAVIVLEPADLRARVREHLEALTRA